MSHWNESKYRSIQPKKIGSMGNDWIEIRFLIWGKSFDYCQQICCLDEYHWKFAVNKQRHSIVAFSYTTKCKTSHNTISRSIIPRNEWTLQTNDDGELHFEIATFHFLSTLKIEYENGLEYRWLMHVNRIWFACLVGSTTKPFDSDEMHNSKCSGNRVIVVAIATTIAQRTGRTLRCAAHSNMKFSCTVLHYGCRDYLIRKLYKTFAYISFDYCHTFIQRKNGRWMNAPFLCQF